MVIIAPDARTARLIASKLNGAYTTTDEIASKFMVEALTGLGATSPPRYAFWLAKLAKQCLVGYSKIDRTVLKLLEKERTAAYLTRPGLERTLASLDRCVGTPTLDNLALAMREMQNAKEARLHSREAWNDIATSLEHCVLNMQLGGAVGAV
ncbi:MAG: hypothetical protein K0U78_03470 [Actinomycetia bacterium]|nr:hypothetical protein [Actinomycetes bacterium]